MNMHGDGRLDRVHADLDEHLPASASDTRRSPRISAQTHAAIAPSVGVKTPVDMPPISRIGVMIGITASNLKMPVGEEQQREAEQPRRVVERRIRH